jgi:hypothetical protein
MRRQAQSMAVVMALVTGIVLNGCGGNRKIHIQGIGDICKQNVRIDVVGMSYVEKSQWTEVSMQDYWSEKNKQRRHDANDLGYLAFKMFEPGKSCDITITEKDRIWKTWKERRATHFLVMFDTCADATGWRICLPLSSKCWRGRTDKNAIEVLILPSGVKSKTDPSPKAACQCK